MPEPKPHEVEIDRDLGIPLPDGTRLSAKVWRPRRSDAPLPAIVEYLPYRKSDMTAARDAGMHPWFAAQGYICLRVDRRGSGDSEGLFDDEYSPQELQDGVDILEWIAAQEWCDGNIGMQGISWGGFNSLQIAALRPLPLKAIISIGSTVDRFADDIHYKGGVQLSENIGWAATLMSISSLPPDPELLGNRWRDIWLERLENEPFLAIEWMTHSNRDAYWQHGSVCENYGDIDIPVLAMGGLHDGYRNTMSHLAENLPDKVKGIAGPWSHKYPHISTVGPSIDYLGLALRWWDRWLKGIENGAETDPAYRAYVMDSARPSPSLDHRDGRWVSEEHWPSQSISWQELPFGANILGHKAPFECNVATDMAHGGSCGEYFPFGFGPGELPDDQTADDALALCFDGDVTETGIDLLGAASVSLRLAADTTRAQVVVRLCDLRPDGTSALIALGLLNLSHREGFEQDKPLVPGETYDVVIPLDQTAYHLPKGHRLRVAIAPSYWPYCWPEGQATTLTVTAGALRIPVRPARNEEETLFDPPLDIAPPQQRVVRHGNETRDLQEENGNIALTLIADHGATEDPETGLVSESTMKEIWRINRQDPTSAQVEITWTNGLLRDDWNVSTSVHTQMWSDAHSFFVKQKLQAFEGETLIFKKTMQDQVQRYANDPNQTGSTTT